MYQLRVVPQMECYTLITFLYRRLYHWQATVVINLPSLLPQITANFWKLWPTNFISAKPVRLQNVYRSRSSVKVIGSRSQEQKGKTIATKCTHSPMVCLRLKDNLVYFYSAPVAVRSIAINPSVCVSVCLSTSMSLEPLDRSARNFACKSAVAVARSSSGGVALRYVLPVLWMTSVTFGRNGGRPARVGSTQCCWSITCATGAECDVYEYLLVFSCRAADYAGYSLAFERTFDITASYRIVYLHTLS